MKHFALSIGIFIGHLLESFQFLPHFHSDLLVSKTLNHKKIAYGIFVHNNETWYGMNELVDKLNNDNSCFVIHVDKKFQIPSKSPKSNVHVIQMFNITWGTFSLTKSMIQLTNFAFRQCTFDIFQFLDGNSYPLHSNQEIQRFYDHLNENIVFSATKTLRSGKSCWGGHFGKDPCRRTKSKCLDEECNLYDNTPRNRPVYKGMQWVTLQYDFVHYMMNNIEWLTEWIEFFRPYKLNDEMFFQTLVMDAGAPQKTFETDVIQTIWGRCRSYVTERSRKKWSPCYVGEKEMNRIKYSSLFLRKLHYDEPIKVAIDKLDAELRFN
eukprot:NODE_38_length_35257_cov_0.939047.p9 type:complete len:322 gc:universal NODE_38_length_35257_cov_0.939047:2636-3601(+)